MPTASWTHLERAIEQLHAAAREPLAVRDFYRQLVAEAATALDVAGGAAWRPGAGGRPELICQSLPDDGVEANWSTRSDLVAMTLTGGKATISSADDREHDWLLCPVEQPAGVGDAGHSPPVAVLEIWMPPGASPPVRQGWLDFAAALADVASDFHARDELRQLRSTSSLHGQAVDLLRRVAAPRSLADAAFEVANEGRRLLACDRVTVLVRRGNAWRLAAVSGADAAPRRGDFARHSAELADRVARWGEPLEHSGQPAANDELPPPLVAAIAQRLDESHARTLACVPITFRDRHRDVASGTGARKISRRPEVVLLAERFDAGPALREPLIELGELCAGALARAAELDRFPVRTALHWSERLAALRDVRQLVRMLAIAIIAACGLAALIFLPVDFTVEAPARLATTIEREVFATVTGAVAEVRVTHGQLVNEGDVLVMLNDPELALKLQEIRGEMDATRKRLEALAVSRTDRTLREVANEDRLPLSAEQRELEERLASLDRQRDLLETRRESLTLRSPCAGQVLTRDVQSLLASRPVERGQALVTIADLSSGWELRADVPQRQISHVLAAEADANERDQMAATFRVAGDVTQSYSGHVVEISAVAPLDAEGLRDEAPPVEVRIAVDGAPPPAARPGMTAIVRIHCGRRSLGYVGFHDVAATLYRWITF
jgi:multidrug efflux pump subunit AcrA (membrane-fusion protein)